MLSLRKLPLLQRGLALFFESYLEALETSSGIGFLVTNLSLWGTGVVSTSANGCFRVKSGRPVD